jgi:hypothetical protein
MKSIITSILVLLLPVLLVNAQEKAVTEKGEVVVLNSNGTWEYLDNDITETIEIPQNTDKFVKSNNSSFCLKSSKFNVGFWLDPKKWSFEKSVGNEESEYNLDFKDGDLYGLIISERAFIPLETMLVVALENAREIAPDIRIVNKEYRNVNGNKVLLIHMVGTTQGIIFFYYGYYFSNSTGTVQFLTYSSNNVFDEYKNDCEELLNGFVEIN